MRRVTKLGLLARALLGQLGLSISCRLMGGVGTALTAEVHGRIARSSGGSLGPASLRLKLLSEAYASTSAPSTVKCSSESSFSLAARATTARKNSPAIACSSSRARLREKVEWSKPTSFTARSRNQRNKKLLSSCSHNSRSLRTVYSAINSETFSSRSGGIEGRPTAL